MKKILALLMAALMVFALCACGSSGGTTEAPAAAADEPAAEPASEPAAQSSGASELAGEYDITIWVADSAVDLTKKQVEDFNASNEYGIVFNATIEAVGEGEAATNMITDVEAGGDIFCFAQDQFARLVQAGALSKLGVSAAEIVTNANDAGTVAAATAGEDLYAYPLTSDNGYFMYYDKSVIPEEDIDSLEALIADCEEAGKFFSMETDTSAWYMASFFFGTGCVSEWTTDEDGAFISVNDTFDSPEGLIAVKGMQKLVTSPMYLSSSEGEGFEKGAAIVVTGTWAYETISNILGDNMGATDLPSFEVDGTEYHMGSYNGCKLLGVKPQTDATKAAALHRLAQYLTSEDAQMERFEALSWGPSNVNAQGNEAVQSNPGLAALIAQAPYSVPQGQIHGSWWDLAKVIATDVENAETEEDLQAALDSYREKIEGLFEMSEEEKNAWSVIGGICGTSWDTDFPMTEVSEGVYQSEPLELNAGEELKVRQGASWDVNYGVTGLDGDNLVVEADGTYIVEINLNTETLSLIVE